MNTEARSDAQFGGFRSVAFFSGLLGFSEDPAYKIASVTRVKGHYEVVVQRGETPVATLVVSAASPGEPSFVGTDALSVVYQGDSIPDEVAAILREKAFRLYPDAGMAKLDDVFLGDPDTFEEQIPEDEAQAESEEQQLAHRIRTRLAGPRSLVADDDAYADFLARYEILCQKVISMWLFNPCTLILHADSECFGPPNLGLNMIMTINAPWDNRVRDLGRPRSSVLRIAEPRAEDMLLYVTDIREADVIRGSESKEREIFEHVFSKDPGLVVFFHACVGVVQGSDIENVFREYKAKHGMPVLYFRGGENRALQDFYTEVLVDVRASTPHPDDAPASRVNLVGYSGHATVPLLEGLEALGATVNGVLLPQVLVEPVVNFEKAGMNVFLPNVDFQNFYDQLKERSGIETHIEPDAPYGIEGTKRWYRTIAEQAGLTDGLEAKLDELAAPHMARWDALKERAKQQKLAFIGRDYEAPQFLESKFTYGVPVLETLDEMGFGLELYLMSTDEKMTEWAKQKLAEGLPEGVSVDVKWFADFDEMMALLDESDARGVFSNLFFDWRATSTGKSTFSLQHFEAGFDGAVLTLERLLRVVETPFYGRYAKYLKRDATGRRLYPAA